MDIVVRRAKASEWETIRDINQSSFEANQNFDPYLDMRWVFSEKAKKYFLTALTGPAYNVFIAEVDDKQVGYIILGPKQYDYRTVRMVEIQNMAVLPTYRSRGIGQRLVMEAKRWAKINGFETIYVNAYIHNTRVVEFYKRQGFTPIDISLEMQI